MERRKAGAVGNRSEKGSVMEPVTIGRATRPVLRWHGGKWLLAPWVLQHFGPHRCYVEPFGGAASVLLRKERSYAEVYNDLDQSVVNLFRVLRSDRAGELVDALRMTPFAREDFCEAYEPIDDAVESARRLVIRSFMGFGSNAHERKSGFRANSNRSGTTPARDWLNYPDNLVLIVERLRGVIIENRDAREIMEQHDSPETLHFVDPPYLPETRDKGGDYAFEMTAADHDDLLGFLCELEGQVILSGYPSELYDDALVGWRRVQRTALADGARPRIECLWLNPRASTTQGDLFIESAA
jgi:DNA adenine methylase